ncbi:unnamed protein product [Rotaria sp. Silwood1]|nr:unnamed protein product [Rotaria sp. Silwood1]CAF1237002.1 unnamed protein product [Rotaria sp. Silwood1]CAF3478131.1 unnamed protein product [Rotaria sp. Silwood1]CAF3518614.1 unnamed protein product [Rotaria sp. Silwood1]
MPTSKKTYKYSVALNVNVVDAPGTQLTTKGDIYINICLLGIHKRTHLMPPYFPMHIHEKFYFDKIFKSCYNPRDIIQRLAREHVLFELLQTNVPTPVILASYERSAKDFLYPYSHDRVQYTGLNRYIILNRTIDFPGITPSLEFTVNASVDDITGIAKSIKTHKYIEPFDSCEKRPKRSKSVTWKPASTYPVRPSLNDSAYVSSSVTSQTISSAVKGDYSQPQTKEKLQELAVPGRVRPVVPLDKTLGREPFVIRHVNEDLVGRKPLSHIVLDDGLVVNDYSFSRDNSFMSLYSLNDGCNCSRSVSPANRRRRGSRRARARSTSPSRCSRRISQSVDFERRGRSRTPDQRSRLHPRTTSCCNDCDSPYTDGGKSSFNFFSILLLLEKYLEFHSTIDCAICRLHRTHSERSRRARSLEQQNFAATSKHKIYSPAVYSSSVSPYLTSATLLRDPFRYRHRQSPAGELSDKILHTLRRNLDSYSAQPCHKYYSSCRYSDGHVDDDELLERSRRLTQD